MFIIFAVGGLSLFGAISVDEISGRDTFAVLWSFSLGIAPAVPYVAPPAGGLL